MAASIDAYLALNCLHAGEKLFPCMISDAGALQIVLRFGLKGSVLGFVRLDLCAALAISVSDALAMALQLVCELACSGFLDQLQFFVPKPGVEPKGFVCEEPLPGLRGKCAKHHDGIQQTVLPQCENTSGNGDEVRAAALHMGS